MHQVPIDRALQVTRAVFQVRAFAQQVLLRVVGQRENERSAIRRAENALLDDVQLKRQNLPEFGLTEGPEYDGLVDTVHELRRELAPRRFDTRAADLLVELLVANAVGGLPLRLACGETEIGTKNRAHLGRAQIAGHEDQRAREVHAAVVAER